MKFNFYFCKSESLNSEDDNFRPHNRSHIYDFYKIKKRYAQEATRYTNVNGVVEAHGKASTLRFRSSPGMRSGLYG